MDGGVLTQGGHYTEDTEPPLLATPLTICYYLYTELCAQLTSRLSRAMSKKSSVPSRALLDISRDKLSTSVGHVKSLSPTYNSLFDCLYCEGFMADPVCLSCGHSICKTCISKVSNRLCLKCKEPVTVNQSHRKPTFMVRNLLQKYFPGWIESYRFREVGNKYANSGDFQLAIEWYDKAIGTGAKDHRVYGNRSRSYLAVNQLDQALTDAEVACSIRPFWKKGHFRRANAFEKQGKWMESVAAYLLCIYLSESEDHSIISKVCQLLDEHMGEFTLYERSLAPQACIYPLKLNKEGLTVESLTPTIDRIVELCLEAVTAVDVKAPIPSIEGIQLDVSDFECSLCTGIVYEPVTITCGHSFCSPCLKRAFDHSQTCPVCRTILYEFFQAYTHNSGSVNVDEILNKIIHSHFPQQCLEKRVQTEAELLRSFRIGTCESEPLPIFVCTQALPGIACPLHVFEPRYRLMMRRCMETGSRRFGMCQAAVIDGNKHSFSDFGTVLYINSLEYTPDGRSLVKTIGERRFRVVGRDLVDGYDRAWVEFVFDERVTDKDDINALRALQTEVYAHAKRWLDALPPSMKELMMQTACSPLPPIEKIPEVCPNGPIWVWWYIHTTPMSSQQKLDLYTCTSLTERLLKLKEALPVIH